MVGLDDPTEMVLCFYEPGRDRAAAAVELGEQSSERGAGLAGFQGVSPVLAFPVCSPLSGGS